MVAKYSAKVAAQYHSAVHSDFYKNHSDMVEHRPDFDRLLLQESDLHRLFDVYCKIDQDFSGQISTWEVRERESQGGERGARRMAERVDRNEVTNRVIYDIHRYRFLRATSA